MGHIDAVDQLIIFRHHAIVIRIVIPLGKAGTDGPFYSVETYARPLGSSWLVWECFTGDRHSGSGGGTA